TQRGWYLPLGNAARGNVGERLVSPMLALAGRLAVANTLVPAAKPGDPCANAPGAQSILYVLDLLTGGAPTNDVFPGYPRCNAIGPISASAAPTLLPAPSLAPQKTIRYFALLPSCTTANCAATAWGLPTIQVTCGTSDSYACAGLSLKKRTWRQLFLR
ncbi:MAG: hypothetical protein ACR2I0_05735, partial [Rhodoferax sp.]